ncbi:OLC1v1003709C1 [Oldenlandia corymbosa var. corymbosa]|uniref:OLC1v1003709C1 n=1 Tax=Oldenlandia corymbosa var. corymbosa TaxID=529605 RepID=A0AAV1DB99_OLDCO|nr:OLC1v1003709C1 [Oldenlandia corymbosa var. corymbosa]
MADSEPKQSPPPPPSTATTTTVESGDEKKVVVAAAGSGELKYLDFVQAAAIYLVVCSSSLYDYAKQNSGPLRTGVQTVEGTVKAVIGPVYQKFRHVPFDLLRFVDRKVDESIHELDHRVPSGVKMASQKLLVAAQKAPEVVRDVASEVRRAGVVDTATNIGKTVYKTYEPTAKEMYKKYEPVAEQYAVSAWRSLNRLPLFPQVAQIVVPTVAHWCEKYNEALAYGNDKGYTASHYLPKVPIERIGKVFQGAETGHTISTNGEGLPVSS